MTDEETPAVDGGFDLAEEARSLDPKYFDIDAVWRPTRAGSASPKDRKDASTKQVTVAHGIRQLARLCGVGISCSIIETEDDGVCILVLPATKNDLATESVQLLIHGYSPTAGLKQPNLVRGDVKIIPIADRDDFREKVRAFLCALMMRRARWDSAPRSSTGTDHFMGGPISKEALHAVIDRAEEDRRAIRDAKPSSTVPADYLAEIRDFIDLLFPDFDDVIDAARGSGDLVESEETTEEAVTS